MATASEAWSKAQLVKSQVGVYFLSIIEWGFFHGLFSETGEYISDVKVVKHNWFGGF